MSAIMSDLKEDIDDLLTFFHEVLPKDMTSKRHSIIVRRFMFKQWRIQLTRVGLPVQWYAREGHGDIVRELCTYRPIRMAEVVAQLQLAEDPEAWCREQEKASNCDAPGHGRIRLDNTPRPAA